jgi:hypothetical protein
MGREKAIAGPEKPEAPPKHATPPGPLSAPVLRPRTIYHAAELILDRAHGKPAYLEDPNRDPDFVPLAERLKAYVRRDQILAAEGKVVQILPPPKGDSLAPDGDR